MNHGCIHPKIGIRPIIDGRRFGVREGLEEKTRKMAEAAAALIAERVRYADGSPVECVIADERIGGCAAVTACDSSIYFARKT